MSALGVLATMIMACGVEAGDEEFGSSDDAIIGGSVDTTHNAVGMIQFDVTKTDGTVVKSTCTGALISPTVVLTAGHCVVSADATVKSVGNWRVFFGPYGNKAAASDFAPAPTAHVHPEYDPKKIGDQKDIAVLVLSKAQSTAPMAFATSNLELVGKQITHVGYGFSMAASASIKSGLGDRRKVTVNVNSTETNTIVTGTSTRTICNGDSGGPGLVTINGVETVVSVASWTQTNCASAGHSARVDRTWTDFLSKYVPAPSTKPAPAPAPAPTTPPSGGDAGTAPQGNYQCCINNDCYVCPDKAAADKCVGFDVNACFASCRDYACYGACSQKASSATRDPSSCTKK